MTNPEVLDLLPRPGGSPLERTRSAMWMTSSLRPAGEFDPQGERRFVAALDTAVTTSQVVLVDLEAVPELPRSVRAAMARANERLNAVDGALLVFDPGRRHHLPEGIAALQAMPPGM